MFTTPVRHFLLAVQFFTRIPITGRLADWVGFSPAMLRASAAYFPAVGWIIGGLTSAVFAGLAHGLPAGQAGLFVAVAFSTIFGVLLTGAFHEDGLADLCDGLGGSLERERALDIMKDSRVGTYGAIALVLVLLARTGLLVLLGQAGLWFATVALFAGHVTSRLLPLFIVLTLPHVGDTAQSKSKPLADQISLGSLLVALAWAGAGLGLAAYLQPGPWWLAAGGAALVALFYMWRLLKRRLAGFTGDGLGATQQVTEVFFYLGLALAMPVVTP